MATKKLKTPNMPDAVFVALVKPANGSPYLSAERTAEELFDSVDNDGTVVYAQYKLVRTGIINRVLKFTGLALVFLMLGAGVAGAQEKPKADDRRPTTPSISDSLKLKLTTAQRDEARRVSRMQQLQLEFAALQQAAAQEAGRIAALVEQANQECGKDHVANPETLACDAKPKPTPTPTAEDAEKKKGEPK